MEIEIKNGNEPDPVPVQQDERTQPSIPDTLPVLPVRNMVIYPYAVTSIVVGQPRSLRLLDDVLDDDSLVVIVASKDPKSPEPGPDELYPVGCVAQVLQTSSRKEGQLNVTLQGLEKARIEDWVSHEPYLRARIEVLSEIEPEQGDIEAQAVRNNLVVTFSQLVETLSYLPDELLQAVAQTKDYRQLTYLVSSSTHLEVHEAQAVLEEDDVLAKMLKLIELIHHELEVMELGKKIQAVTRGEMEKAQREYVLRQQLRAIRQELGEDDGSQARVEEYRGKIEASGMTEEAQAQANRELARLERLPEASSEYGVILTYLDWLVTLPWRQATEEILDTRQAETILNEDHYGLEKIKRRILEYLAVRQLRQQRAKQAENAEPGQGVRPERQGAILCFVGPPGIGKTSLGHSIARALGRKLHRISLGGIRDEAEIRGHRRTYVGAMPGRFIKALRDVGSRNPVLLLDEVDKLGADWQGDPAAALLEVLDPEQNRDFRDRYLDVAFDLSSLMFIATANVLDNIPGPLRDRLEVITLPGYTDDEKLNIAQRYLLPRQRRENALREEELRIEDDALLTLIREYTREAGVRSLDRRIGALCRKAVVRIAERTAESLVVDLPMLKTLMGKPMFFYDLAERTGLPGVATGLAVTAVGGDILFVEASAMPGKKGLTITGQLGDVMRESAQAALSYVRSQAGSLGIDAHFFEDQDIHIHIPAGAIPKDGPSAGVALVTALVSLLTRRPVHHEVGMTGEMTLRGQVLPVGGIKDKVLAAHRAGLRTVILPKRNEKDLDDLPESVRDSMQFVLADRVDTVLDTALIEASD
ncbi:MAG: endopeptidase La [Marinobacter sp.]|uniref:endopeptidase La n=1 Tax=Marinobacter sp. TaxID=50741 RepID=UPI00299F47A9|nr:endopeptidase La [Marinobacter sp.]MDX1754618.1 endopeptidase La [Marinobacter sp.]